MTTPQVELYVRAGCHLCDDFLLGLALDHPDTYQRLQTRDVDGDDELAARYGLRVPVLAVDGRVACEGRYDRDEVTAALRL
jgi:Glutaredoxin-like domain (DUF836)